MKNQTDYIDYRHAKTLSGLFLERSQRSPEHIAYHAYDPAQQTWVNYTWAHMHTDIVRWQTALSQAALAPGTRVAIHLPNSPEWVQFDQAALGLGLVVVPLYTNDRPDNLCYILQDADVQIILVNHLSEWQNMAQGCDTLNLQKVIVRTPLAANESSDLIIDMAHYLHPSDPKQSMITRGEPDDLASIVYTSGTTGRPKGVMLSHHNMLWNAYSGLQSIPVYPSDHLLSFLPLSHTLERSIGYYLCVMSGCKVSFARSVQELGEDLLTQKPTLLVAVPRIFERVYGKIQQSLSTKSALAHWLFKQASAIGWQRFLHQQKRAPWSLRFLFWPLLNQLVAAKIVAKLGGNLRFAIAGGAPMSVPVAKLFIGLGVPISQGYGLTETSPVISVNRLTANIIESVGTPLQGVEIKVGAQDELLVRSPGVMLGYWHNPTATAEMITAEGWLHTGDKVNIEDEHIFITGRLKEIIVLSNGEKLPPNDLEMAICLSPYIDQAMIIGDNRPFLSALVVLNETYWPKLAEQIPDGHGNLFSGAVKQQILDIIATQIHDFPGYARIHAVHLTLEPWSVDNQLATPTLKLKRHRISEHYASEIEKLYAGH